MAYQILNLCGLIPFIGVLFSLAGLVCWILYWVQIAGFSKKLEEGFQPLPADDDWRYGDRYGNNPPPGDDRYREER